MQDRFRDFWAQILIFQIVPEQHLFMVRLQRAIITDPIVAAPAGSFATTMVVKALSYPLHT